MESGFYLLRALSKEWWKPWWLEGQNMMMLNALSHISDDYILRTLQDMKNRGASKKEQLQFIKEQCRHYGFAGPNLPRLRGSNKGLTIEFEKSQGFPEDKIVEVSWSELLTFAEVQGYVQPALGLKPVEVKASEEKPKIRGEALQRFVERGEKLNRFATEGRMEEYLTVPKKDSAVARVEALAKTRLEEIRIRKKKLNEEK